MVPQLFCMLCFIMCVYSLPSGGDYSPDKGKNSAGGKLAAAIANLHGNQGSGAGSNPSALSAPSASAPASVVNNDVPGGSNADGASPSSTPDDGKYSPEKGKSSSAGKLASAIANLNKGGSGGPSGGSNSGSGMAPAASSGSSSSGLSQANNMPQATDKNSPAWRISEAFVKYQATNGGRRK